MTIQTVQLSSLRLSPLNVRKVKPRAVEEMAATIEAHGLLQNLLGYEEDGLFHIFGGGRRFRALHLLKKQKKIEAGFPVPVDVRSKDEAVTLSLAENVARENMHPADQVAAFAALRDTGGLTAAEIAAQFGYAESHVRKLLRLGSLPDALLKAFAKDQLSLASAQALCLTDDPTRQQEAFKKCGNSDHAIRRFLTSEKMQTTSAKFMFVGRDAYEAAGGTVTIDLFSEGSQGYADNPELVEDLALAKLDAIEADLIAQGWSKVEVSADHYGIDLYSRPRLYPARREATQEEAEKMARIDAAIADKEEAGDEDEALSALFDRQAELEAALRAFTSEQKASGCVVAYIAHDGTLTLAHFRIRSGMQDTSARKRSATESGPYSAALIEDLSKIKTQVVQEAVAANPTLALDILLDSLVGQMLHGSYGFEQAASLRPEQSGVAVPPDLMAVSDVQPVAELMAERFADIPADTRFETIRAMAEGDKMQLLAGLVALTIDGTLSRGCSPSTRQALIEQYARAANIDMAQRWQAPIGLFDRMKKSALLTILTDACGKDAAENCAKMKKSDLAAALAQRLPVGWLPSPLTIGAFDEKKPEQIVLDEAA
ncbi:ParB family chromosome partitioning protein [Sphingobium sp. B1D7B]|uniref:ParB/RepB/Spo0J family partition protein n=1 Tax=Sphingobium sp. B1D7B TaxID=2940578 RepID=UPI002224DBA8|nr:ParB/RepB/Spo0J family partition protein [Sphingobium sp. B1D7B]MCW2406905.1 ParB family chromosome partitioning protein [Sphingobium sp. B1D7B]